MTTKAKKAPAADYVITHETYDCGVPGLFFLVNALEDGGISDRHWNGDIRISEATRMTLSDARFVREGYANHYRIDLARLTIVKVIS